MDIHKELEALPVFDTMEIDEDTPLVNSTLSQISKLYQVFSSQITEDKNYLKKFAKSLKLLEEQVEDKREQIRKLKQENKEVQKDKNTFLNELLDIMELVTKLNEFAQIHKDNPITEEIGILYKHVLHRLDMLGIEEIQAIGATLNPDLHEAAGTVNAPNRKTYEIVEVLRPGFRRGDEVLRKTLVITAE